MPKINHLSTKEIKKNNQVKAKKLKGREKKGLNPSKYNSQLGIPRHFSIDYEPLTISQEIYNDF